MKVRRAFLALLLSVSCAFSGSFAVSAQAVESEPATLEEGLKGYWDFEGEDPMENKGSDASLSGSLSGNAVSVQQSSVEEMGSVLHFDTRSGESSRMLIASALNLSDGTARNYISAIYLKLGCDGRADAIAKMKEKLGG